MNRFIVVIGGGGHAKVVIQTARKCGDTVVAVLDDDVETHGSALVGVPVEGSDETLDSFCNENIFLAIGVGALGPRRKLFEAQKKSAFRHATLIHPSAEIGRGAAIGEGAQVMAGAVIQPDARVGLNCIINTCASVDHDCVISDHAHIASGAVLAGNVKIGAETLVGAGAVILPNVRIGDGVIIGAGSVVVRNVADGVTVVGNPAMELEA